MSFCEEHNIEMCKKVMVLLSSAYKVLLDYVHMHSASHDCETQSAIHEDGDDVYYRFGGQHCVKCYISVTKQYEYAINQGGTPFPKN